MSIQALLNSSIFPLISRKVTRGINTYALRTTTLASVVLLSIGLIGALLTILLADVLIPIWYPKYIDALPLLAPLLLAAAFRLSDFWTSYLIIIHRQNILLKIQIFLILIPCLYYYLCSEWYPELKMPYYFSLLALFLAFANYAVNAFFSFFAEEKLHAT